MRHVGEEQRTYERGCPCGRCGRVPKFSPLDADLINLLTPQRDPARRHRSGNDACRTPHVASSPLRAGCSPTKTDERRSPRTRYRVTSASELDLTASTSSMTSCPAKCIVSTAATVPVSWVATRSESDGFTVESVQRQRRRRPVAAQWARRAPQSPRVVAPGGAVRAGRSQTPRHLLELAEDDSPIPMATSYVGAGNGEGLWRGRQQGTSARAMACSSARKAGSKR